MNVVIFGKGFGKPRQISLPGTKVALFASLIVGAFCAVAFFGGYLFSKNNGSR